MNNNRPAAVIAGEKEHTMKDYTASAAALYNGGWRVEDRDQLIEEYELTEEEADKICEILASYEK